MGTAELVFQHTHPGCSSGDNGDVPGRREPGCGTGGLLTRPCAPSVPGRAIAEAEQDRHRSGCDIIQ